MANIAKKILFWVVFLSFWGVAIWTLFFSEVMRVRQVVSAGATANLGAEEIERQVKQKIGGKYLNLVPRDNLLLISARAISKDLKNNNKLIREVQVKKKFPTGIVVEVEQRESHIIWCSGQRCMLVDERGEAFCEADCAQEGVIVKVIDTSDKPYGFGERVADPEFVMFSEQLPLALQNEIHVEAERQLWTPSSMSEEVRARTVDGWEVYFSTARPLEVQLKILKEILHEKVQPGQVEELEYVDLRIKGKATYKLKVNEQEKEDSEKEDRDQD